MSVVKGIFIFIFFILLMTSFAGAVNAVISNNAGMGSIPGECVAPGEVLAFFEGVPYREDGVTDRFGNFTLFAEPEVCFDSAGLNCSGFITAASRYFFDRNYALKDVPVDRLGDSGPDAENGEDWDFGYDLLLNLTEGMERKVLQPYGEKVDIDTSNGRSLRGFSLQDRSAWSDVISKMVSGNVYLFSMSKPVRFKKYSIIHYHVGVIVPDANGAVWLCHATRKSGVTKVDISSLERLDPILRANPDNAGGERMIFIVEVPLK